VDEEELIVYHGGLVQVELVVVGGKASPVVLDV
jgi:hypothetical protein